jgi:chromosome segregation protein
MLKSLELFGFKSFADRTLFDFAPGITCVVGPNGSGKSNVVDAIKWILGDQSAKSLRGKEMSDVIFNGSAQRRGSGFAEATLTFNNEAGLLPVDAAEVQIGRRLYQSGDSEYLLNRSPVRLKDIRDLFMGTGAGTVAYSIIEQGRVDQILQANPTARRVVFEEAAGISKFKSRRVDAERRLERVAQNLLRLTDIVDQVESQLNSVRSQASKAAKYRELAAELKTAWTGLAADDSRMIREQLTALINERMELAGRVQTLQAELENVTQAMQGAEQRLSGCETELHRCERTLSNAREALGAQESTRRHQSQRSRDLQADISRVREERRSFARQLDQAQAELAQLAAQLSELERRFGASGEQIEARETELRSLSRLADERQARLDGQRRELTDCQQRRTRSAQQLAVLRSQEEALEHARDQARQRHAQLQTQRDEAAVERESRLTGLNDAELALQARQAQLTDAQQQQFRTIQQRDETERQLLEMRERRSAAEARLALLEELEERQEGIAIGVKEILRRAETSHYPPWNRVLGTVRDLIEAPLDLAPIIDAALGDRAQLIAIADLAPLMDYLNRGAPPIDGRVGFVSLAVLESDTEREETADLTGMPGVYGRADRVVQERERAAGLAERVLGDTWIVETLDDARRLAAEQGERFRAVTLQGEVLYGGTQLSVGTLPHESSMISRKSVLRQLKNEILQLQRDIQDATQRQAILSEHFGNRSEELDGLTLELKRLASAVSEGAAQLAAQDREWKRLDRELAEQWGTLAEQDRRLAALQTEAARRQAEKDAGDAEAAQLQTQLEAETADMAQVQDLLRQTQQQIKAEQLELAKHEERIRGLRDAQARLLRDQASQERQRRQLDERAAELEGHFRQSQMEVLHAESRIAALAIELDGSIRQTRQLALQRESLRQDRAALLGVEEERRTVRREMLDRERLLDFEIQKIELQQKTLADRIQEEYQLTLAELTASGTSAYQAFLQQRYGSDGARSAIAAAGETDASPPPHAGSVPSEVPAELFPAYAEIRGELEAHVDRLRRKLKLMGAVNTDALESLEELETRHAGLASQLTDLQEAKAALEDIIRRINHESQRIFLETFEAIRGHFRELFRKLFGGGDADIILEDPADVLECGIDIVARPPGKELRSISLLSGGEKTMTAVALLFAMFKSKPSPYCILDEVDAALDEANVDRYVSVIKEFVQMTQFVVITHRKRTMTAADVLYGVTMEQAGVSKRIAVRFEDVRDNGEIRSAA